MDYVRGGKPDRHDDTGNQTESEKWFIDKLNEKTCKNTIQQVILNFSIANKKYGEYLLRSPLGCNWKQTSEQHLWKQIWEICILKIKENETLYKIWGAISIKSLCQRRKWGDNMEEWRK